MRRKLARPYGQSISGKRLVSMIMALVVLGMLYYRFRDPATWSVITSENDVATTTNPPPLTTPEPETVIPGPNDQDDNELANIQAMFEFVTDRAPLKSREMDAYWRLMDWSRTQPFAEQEQRARQDVPFTQLWEQPERYRGQLVRLRMHVRRVLQYDAPGNPSGIAKVCEAWGWTDESRSYPYVVVFPEPAAGLPIGTDVRTEIVFVGYFLKVMTYTAFDNPRGAPLLVGRARVVAPTVIVPAKTDPGIMLLAALGGIVVVGLSVWFRIRTRARSTVRMLPNELSTLPSAGPVNFNDQPFPFADESADHHPSILTFNVTTTGHSPPSAGPPADGNS
jgi:hypothetical protein